MKKISLALVLLSACATHTNVQCPEPMAGERAVAEELVGLSMHFDYGDFQADVDFGADMVTWSDGTVTETDAARVYRSAPGVFFVQWLENDGTFVTLIVNLNEMTVHNSVLPPNSTEAWFSPGVISMRE